MSLTWKWLVLTRMKLSLKKRKCLNDKCSGISEMIRVLLVVERRHLLEAEAILVYPLEQTWLLINPGRSQMYPTRMNLNRRLHKNKIKRCQCPMAATSSGYLIMKPKLWSTTWIMRSLLIEECQTAEARNTCLKWYQIGLTVLNLRKARNFKCKSSHSHLKMKSPQSIN